MVDERPGRRGARTRRQWRGHRQGGPGNGGGGYDGAGAMGVSSGGVARLSRKKSFSPASISSETGRES